MQIYDSYMSFVNCHMAADTIMVERRNQDFEDICKRMTFSLQPRFKDYRAYTLANPWVSGVRDSPHFNATASSPSASDPFNYGSTRSTASLFDTDHLIWMGNFDSYKGDLNYRVTLPEKESKILLDADALHDLLAYDQVKYLINSS